LLGTGYLICIEDQHWVHVLVVVFLFALVEAVLAAQEIITSEAEIHQTTVAVAAAAVKAFELRNLVA
jgi:hypothetical protein